MQFHGPIYVPDVLWFNVIVQYLNLVNDFVVQAVKGAE